MQPLATIHQRQSRQDRQRSASTEQTVTCNVHPKCAVRVLIICGCIRCRMKFVRLLLSTISICVLASGNRYVSVILLYEGWRTTTLLTTTNWQTFPKKNLTGKVLGDTKRTVWERIDNFALVCCVWAVLLKDKFVWQHLTFADIVRYPCNTAHGHSLLAREEQLPFWRSDRDRDKLSKCRACG